MNTIARNRHAPAQLSLAGHACGALAAVALIAAGAAFAGHASEHAVRSELAALNPSIRYIVLPSVEIVARRDAGAVAQDTGCTAPVAKS